MKREKVRHSTWLTESKALLLISAIYRYIFLTITEHSSAKMKESEVKPNPYLDSLSLWDTGVAKGGDSKP